MQEGASATPALEMEGAVDADAGATAARVHQRVMDLLRRPIPPRDAVHLAAMCATRERELSLQVYAPADFAARTAAHAESLALTQAELESFVGSERHGVIDASLSAAQRTRLAAVAADAGVAHVIEVIGAQLRNAMVDPLVARNWQTLSCRLASVVAFALDDPIDALRVVIGPFAEGDARRLLARCNAIDECEGDSARLLDAVDAAAHALSECVAP